MSVGFLVSLLPGHSAAPVGVRVNGVPCILAGTQNLTIANQPAQAEESNLNPLSTDGGKIIGNDGAELRLRGVSGCALPASKHHVATSREHAIVVTTCIDAKCCGCFSAPGLQGLRKLHIVSDSNGYGGDPAQCSLKIPTSIRWCSAGMPAEVGMLLT